jgi:hypothetical protein
MSLVHRILLLLLGVILISHLSACARSDSDGLTDNENSSTLVGIVEDISSTTWIIDGKNIQVDDEVLIRGNIMIGDEVEALVKLGENATLQAIEIDFLSRNTSVKDDDQTPADFSGIVEMITPKQWTIGGWPLIIESQTQIKGNPKVGDLVQVSTVQREDGSFSALEIKPTDNAATGRETEGNFEFSGVVDEMEVGRWVVDKHIVIVTSETEIDEDITLGDEVKVEGILAENGTVTATEIKMLSPD